MNRAYLFPFEVVIDPTQAHRATPVDLNTAHKTLVQAARHHRLRCTWGDCLEPVTPVRQEGSLTQVRCFAHLPATPESPFCPYRTYKEDDPKAPPEFRRQYSPEHNLRKLIENDLRVELQRNLTGRGQDVEIKSSDYREKEPRIRITGLGPPLQIRGLAPGCEKLWSEPFAGSVDGEEVLFFVVSPDAPSLRQPFIDDHLLARRPAIVVYPGERDGEHTYAIVSGLADPVTAMPFDTLDLLRVDYGQLFGLDRAAEYLFIPGPYRQVIEEIGARLAVAGLAPEEAKALRLYAKRLLVDGAAVHSSVFGQSREEARRYLLSTKTFPQSEGILNTAELGRLLLNQELQRFCAGEPLLLPLWEEVFVQAYANLGGTIGSLRKQVAELQSRLDAAVAMQTEQAGKLTEGEAQRQILESQIRDKERALSEWETGWGKERAAARAAAAAALRRQEEEAGRKLAATVEQLTELTKKWALSEAQREESEGRRRELASEVEALRRALTEERQRRQALELSLAEVNSHVIGHWMLEHYLGGHSAGQERPT